MTYERDKIDAKYKWDLSVIYPDEAAFSADFAEVEKMIEAYPAHEKTMLSSPEALCKAFDDLFAATRIIEKLYEYAGRNFDVDTAVNKYQSMSSKVIDLYNKLGAASYFVTPYLLKLDEETLNKWYETCPELNKYRRIIEVEFRRKPYTLSDECEKLMADISTGLDSHDNIYKILTDSDMTFGKIKGEDGKPVELTDTNYVLFLTSRDRRVRRAAFNKLYSGYKQFGNSIATVLGSFVKEKATLVKVRGYSSSLEASTFADEVTPEIYNNLIDTVNKNLEVLFDYYDLKRQMLGLSSLHMYDLYPPLIADYDKKYSYDEAVDEVLETVKVFGDEYYNALSVCASAAGLTFIPTRESAAEHTAPAATIPSPIFCSTTTENTTTCPPLPTRRDTRCTRICHANTTTTTSRGTKSSLPRSPQPSTSCCLTTAA